MTYRQMQAEPYWMECPCCEERFVACVFVEGDPTGVHIVPGKDEAEVMERLKSDPNVVRIPKADFS